MKYIQRQPETVDAYQFMGGEKDGVALAKLIDEMTRGAASAYYWTSELIGEIVNVVHDGGSFGISEGDWIAFYDDDTYKHFTKEEFSSKFKQVRAPVKVIWKDIPGFPHFQIGDNGKVKDVFFGSYKRRTKDGDFILRTPRGAFVRWSEKEIGNEEEVKAFFAN